MNARTGRAGDTDGILTRTNLYCGSNFFWLSSSSYTNPNPVLDPPPKLVLNPKTTTLSLSVLYSAASFSPSSDRERLARVG